MNMQRIGPSTVPWEIPDITLSDSDSRPFADTHWNIPTNSLIQVPNFPETPSDFDL